MFVAVNMFWARLRLILARAIRRGLKCTQRRAKSIVININCITIIITLEGIDKIKTEKQTVASRF